MRRTVQGWTTTMGALATAVALLGTVVNAENGGPGDSPPAVSPPTAKLISLKFRDPQYLHGVLMPLGLQISPDVQTSRLLVIARSEEIKQVEDLVRELDVPIERTQDQPQLELKLYRLRHRQPTDLVQCVTPMLSDRGRISADAGSRTLLVKDEPAVHTDVAMIIREIDTQPDDVIAVTTMSRKEGLPPVSRPVEDTPDSSRVLDRSRTNMERSITVRVRVCEINRTVLNTGGDDPDSIFDNPLSHEIRDGAPLQVTFESGTVETCIAEMAGRGMLKIVCEPAIAVLSGSVATFVSGGDEFEGPVVIEEDSLLEATTRVSGLPLDLKFVPTILDRGRIRLQMAAQFLPPSTVTADGKLNGEDRPAEILSVELDSGQVLAASGKISISKPAEAARGGLRGVPVFGQLLRSKRNVTQEIELIVFASATADSASELEDLARQPGRDEPRSR